MTHDELRALLPWYANRTLGRNDHEVVERHVESCPDCARELDELRVLLSASEHLKQDVPESSSDLLERTLQKVARHERKRAAPKHWRIPLSLAASLIVAIMVGALFLPTEEAMNHASSFSTGGNAYHAELILEMLMNGELDVHEAVELMNFAS